VLDAAATGLFPYTPATNLLFGLRARWPCSTRKACPRSSPGTPGTPRRPAARPRLGLGIVCQNPDHYSLPSPRSWSPMGTTRPGRQLILDRYNMSLGAGLGRLPPGPSASATWEILATCRWRARCAAWRWPHQRACPSPEGVRAALDYLGSAA